MTECISIIIIFSFEEKITPLTTMISPLGFIIQLWGFMLRVDPSGIQLLACSRLYLMRGGLHFFLGEAIQGMLGPKECYPCNGIMEKVGWGVLTVSESVGLSWAPGEADKVTSFRDVLYFLGRSPAFRGSQQGAGYSVH